jgi:hypothetical protein
MDKYPRPSRAKPGNKKIFIASEFQFDPVELKCICPVENEISFRGTHTDQANNHKAFFEGRLSQCSNCELKSRCMKNPAAADHRKGKGRQVSFILNKSRKPNFTDWMKHRVGSTKGKLIYSYRMSVVEPVFGNLTINKRLRHFNLRGLRKVAPASGICFA